MKTFFLTLLALGSAAQAQLASPSYLSDFVKALDLAWPKNRTMTIVCHGHSVPAGYAKTPHVDSFVAYPHLLHRAVKEKHPHAVINVIVTAIGGENSVSGAARFQRDVLPHKPDVVLIDYGLNDRRLPLEKSATSWQQMIDEAKAAGAKVILLTPTGDTSAKMLEEQDPLSKQAAQIRSLAEKNGVALADSYLAYQNWIKSRKKIEALMSQVNHPNAAGHQLVLEQLLPWFRPAP
jgi:lysophospholipase L1-like esterase